MRMRQFFCNNAVLVLVFTFTIISTSLFAQQIRINEVVSSNSFFLDEDGDTPDWFELRNTGATAINLQDWTISDDITESDKWIFPNSLLGPNEYMVVWASSKDRVAIGYPRTLVEMGDEFRYLVPDQKVDGTWTTLVFDDSSWTLGKAGFGYGDEDDSTVISNPSISVFVRKNFTITDIKSIEELILDIDYDDAFVAYLNGVEIARANISGTPPDFDTQASTGREAELYNNGIVERFIISNYDDILVPGDNVLAVQAHNVSANSSDLSLIPFLSVVYSAPSTDGVEPPELLQLQSRYLHTNFKISSSGETLYLFNADSVFIDSLNLPDMQGDISIGTTDESTAYVLYETPTPGLENTGDFYDGILTDIVDFSDDGGIVSAFSLTLSGATSSAVIRYTLDATEPTSTSAIYGSAIGINTNTTVRAAIFKPNFLPSEIQSRSYLVNQSHKLPIISLVTDPKNFFDSDEGIYVLGDDYEGDFPFFGSNIWEEWEKPVHVSFYEPNGTLGVAFNAGVKIFGGWSRANDQRSLSIFARGKYGTDEIDYPLFQNLPYTSFQSIVLRNSGNDWLSTTIRDATLTGLMKSADLEIQAYRPIVNYLNGEYWGIYNMREKINEHYLASQHDVSINKIDLLEVGGSIIYGDNQEYLELIQFVQNNSLANETNYNQVALKVDIDNFIIYQIAQIYFDNQDWPGNNIKFWKHDEGKWRWILYDTDFGFGIWNTNSIYNNTLAFALEKNGPDWPNPPWSTLMFRKLIENETFRNKFINRFADEMNTRFEVQSVLTHIDSTAAKIESEVSAHYSRWGSSYQSWQNNVDNMRYFGENRSVNVKNHIKYEFGLSSVFQITVNNESPDKGLIKINSLLIKGANWKGEYFSDVPIKVKAVPNTGHAFSHWTGSINSNNAEIEIELTRDMIYEPHFVQGDLRGLAIVINEINYNSGEEKPAEDWIELYNPNIEEMDISNWEMKDDDDSHSFKFPSATILLPQSYLIVTRNNTEFTSFYPDLSNVVGDFEFGLSSEGDAVRIYNQLGELQDEVHFESIEPWSIKANGTGSTLELTNPYIDNGIPESWGSMHQFGSPGHPNFSITGIEVDAVNTVMSFYPNPFTSQINIELQIEKSLKGTLSIYNLNGLEVAQIFNGELAIGHHQFKADLQKLSKGIYLLKYADELGNMSVLKCIK